MTTDLRSAAERLRRLNSGETLRQVYGVPYHRIEPTHPYHADLRLAVVAFICDYHADEPDDNAKEGSSK